MPAKIAVEGENTYRIYIRGSFRAYIGLSVETYHSDTPGDGGRKRAQDIHSWG